MLSEPEPVAAMTPEATVRHRSDLVGAFASWYAAEGTKLLRVFVGLASGDQDLGEDLLAEACARTWTRWEQVADPTGYTYRIGVNLLRRQWRHRRPPERLADRPTTPQVDPDLWAAVAALPRRQREVVVLRYVGDMTEPQIAEALSLSRGAIATHLSRARKALRDELEETHRD